MLEEEIGWIIGELEVGIFGLWKGVLVVGEEVKWTEEPVNTIYSGILLQTTPADKYPGEFVDDSCFTVVEFLSTTVLMYWGLIKNLLVA